MGGEAKHGLWVSNVNIGKCFPTGLLEQISCTFLGPKVITVWDSSIWVIFPRMVKYEAKGHKIGNIDKSLSCFWILGKYLSMISIVHIEEQVLNVDLVGHISKSVKSCLQKVYD